MTKRSMIDKKIFMKFLKKTNKKVNGKRGKKKTIILLPILVQNHQLTNLLPLINKSQLANKLLQWMSSIHQANGIIKNSWPRTS